MTTQTLLVIDDEPNITAAVRATLSSPQLRVESAGTAAQGMQCIRQMRVDAVLLDVHLPDMSGLDLFDRIHQADSRLPVIIMTAFAKTDTAIEAMRRGAFEYFVKPVDFGRLRAQVQKALEVSRLSRIPALVGDTAEGEEDADLIVGNSPEMQDVYKTIGRVAPQDATVLIQGESGTGKELAARAIYHYSRRASRPFLAINCAALSETLLESELFGHERGAFTGADQRRIGKFEQVNGGTIFLDEIGDMSPATQAKTLRLLQQQQFERVGGHETIQTDVRIVAATNRDLESMVAAGEFRQDLYYRLNGFVISLPPLRSRPQDLEPLTAHFIRRCNRELGKNVRMVTPEAMRSLQEYNWPGNVREFQSAIRFAMVQAVSDVLTLDLFPESCRRRPRAGRPAVVASIPDAQDAVFSAAPPSSSPLEVISLVQQLIGEGTSDVYRHAMQAIDSVLVAEVLKHTNGNQQRAAQVLGISRMTLRSKLRAATFSSAGNRTTLSDVESPT